MRGYDALEAAESVVCVMCHGYMRVIMKGCSYICHLYKVLYKVRRLRQLRPI